MNARDAMPDGGRLRIHAGHVEVDSAYAAMVPGMKPGPHFLLEVRDTGTGIRPEVLERIFDPFFTTKENGKGTGLGLATTLGIVKGHGGVIQVDTHVGAGTTFRIYLPASAGEAAAAHEQEAAAPVRGHGELILVVDDEPRIHDIARSVLEENGYRVITATDGVDALSVFAQHMGEVAAVVTDVMMPYMDGVALSRALRKMKPALPITASTGVAEKAMAAELRGVGLAAVLNKPYGVQTLLKAVGEMVHANAAAA